MEYQEQMLIFVVLSFSSENEEGISRSLDNLGRVYARIGKFDLAVEHWTEKLPLVKSALEATWLHHEIGRCHLELGDFQEARDCGQKSLQAAQEAGDDVWQLNASVLIAQSEGGCLMLFGDLISIQAYNLCTFLGSNGGNICRILHGSVWII